MVTTSPITLVALVAGLVLSGVIAAQSKENFLLDQQTLSRLQQELSGELAKEHVVAISQYHRIPGSSGYTEAARYVLQQLHGFGYRAWIESFPAEGRILYQTWQSPPGWNIESGELRMIQPQNELVVSYSENPMSVMTYSNPGQVRAELVDVGVGTSDEDYQEKEVEGKLVLATGDCGEVHRLGVLKYGAAGVVCYLDDERASEYPDMLHYTEWLPRSDEMDRLTFGFNLTSQQGQKLKGLLNEGKRVVLEAKVEGRGVEFGSLDVVVTLIPGIEKPDQELLYIAHLDHPKHSANDNASGSAAILDIARTLRALIDEGKLPPPKRTIRFLWVPGMYGTMAYVDAHPEIKGPELGGNVLAGLNLDMVGENLELLHSRLNITWTPQSISSVVTDVTARMAEYVDRLDVANPGHLSNFNYRVLPFSGGSDHVVLNDGMIGVPSVRLGHWPDFTYHTNQDTPEKVDPIELKRSELIAAATFWYLANLSERQSLELTNLVAAKAQGRIAIDTQRASSWLLEAPVDRLEEMYNEGKRVITFGLEREQQGLNSALYFAPFESTRRLVQTWNQTLDNQSQVIIRTLQALVRQRGGSLSFSQERTYEEREAASWIPSRTTRGPLAHDLPQSQVAAWRTGLRPAKPLWN
ncbi:DUF4910 domain-containing protein [Acidobacteria bacterium AH-259-D05]|nr:DUF4910 domain-containing protein [Acidobacteria bacterium AH-259-D05]